MTTLFQKIKTPVIALCLAAITACSNDDNAVENNPANNYVSAEAYLEEVGFKGTILIKKGGEDVLRKGFGWADETNNVLNNPSLIYRIGSVTKSFTSAAIINLKRDGLIESLDQPLSDFDDAFPQGNQITIRHLLTHHSGIPDYVGGIEAYVEENNVFVEREEILEAIVDAITEDGLAFTPGEFFSYSNSNYFILGMLVEELTGMSYQEYLAEKVYTPLGFTNTAKGPNEIIDASRAKGYSNGVEVDSYQMQIAFSAGEIESTIDDLEKWGAAMLGTYYTTQEKQEVFAAPFGQDGVNVPGAGWFTLELEGEKLYHHGGDVAGFTSFLLVAPESDGILILLSNEEGKGEQRNEIMETIVKNEF